MNIAVLGWFGHANCGDEAYKEAYPRIFPTDRFFFADNASALIACSPSVLVLGGGHVISDSFLNAADKIPATKRYVFSVSVAKNDPLQRLKDFDGIYVRDYRSYAWLVEAGLVAHCLPDFAFVMEPDPQRGKQLLANYLAPSKHKTALVVFNSYLLPRYDTPAREAVSFHKATWEMARIFDEQNLDCLFVPFCTALPSDDRISNAWLASHCQRYRSLALVWHPLACQDLLDLTAAVDVVISTRLHCSIFACMCGKPFIDVTHHDKNVYFLDSIYKQDWSVPYWEFSYHRFADLLRKHLEHGDSTELNLRAKTNRNLLREFGKGMQW